SWVDSSGASRSSSSSACCSSSPGCRTRSPPSRSYARAMSLAGRATGGIVVEEEPPPGQPLLGLYQGIPLTRRTSGYSGVLPDKITIYRGPLERLYGADPETLRLQIRHVVIHEVAHHFGISDERLQEMGRY